MIEIRLRAAASNPASRKYSFALALLTTAIFTVAPVVTSRAQDATTPHTMMTAEVDGLRATRTLTLDSGRTLAIDAGEAVSITSGAASITLRKDGTIVLKGTEIVIDGAHAAPGAAPCAKPDEPTSRRAALMSEIF